ncbi:unnamed protein product [Adineta steineri]|uniref:FAD-binding PCMH-type domain-containing protein n=1 Tax=Adineta steineri TaxID=433720 RepID=A0A819BTR5_9BILA|nr:unnamed protein product [Adineta steineri]CAF3807572.1 unnamed protein product [Adineta steineri]
MKFLSILYIKLLLILLSSINALPNIPPSDTNGIINSLGISDKIKILTICNTIKNSVSSGSHVYYPLDLKYPATISHYSISSTNLSVCSVVPCTANDVSIIIKIIGENRVPFGIKSGGHTLNPGFSSTNGIQISMQCFNKVAYNSTTQTVDVGPGLIWDDVYRQLQPYNVSVTGGRLTGVGVGGFLLGGGYSWKSNQYGLAIDNILEYELVTPNGTIVIVNNQTYPDLYFGLKGGLNNFGIVTKFIMRALPQTQVYGGVLYYLEPQFGSLIDALINFSNNNKDPKAQLICSFGSILGVVFGNVYAFYDAPEVPDGIFNEFINIDPLGELKSQSYLSFVQELPVDGTDNMRGRFHTVSVPNITRGLAEQVKQLAIQYTAELLPKGCTFVYFQIEPFLPSYFGKSQGGAYPHSPSNPLFPMCLQFGWQLEIYDQDFIDAIKSVADSLLQAAIDDGQNIDSSKDYLYPNYALSDTPLSKMYGSNVDRLISTRQQVDPKNVMNLTGGFIF